MDGDGDVDAVFGGTTVFTRTPSTLQLNDGTGSFTSAPALMPTEEVQAYGIALQDLDGDGDPDLVVTNDRLLDTTRLYLNDGTGSFLTQGELPVDADGSTTLAVGDVDGDGDRDLVLDGPSGIFVPRSRLYLNDVPSPAGEASVHQPLPPDAGLVGTRFYVQGVFLEPGHRLRLTGFVAEQIRP